MSWSGRGTGLRSATARGDDLSHFVRILPRVRARSTVCGQEVDLTFPERDATLLIGREQCEPCYRAIAADRDELTRVLDANEHKLGPAYWDRERTT